MEWQQPLHTARQDGILVCSTWIHSSISTELTASHASTGPRHVYAATALRLSRGVVVCLLRPRPSGAKLNTMYCTKHAALASSTQIRGVHASLSFWRTCETGQVPWRTARTARLGSTAWLACGALRCLCSLVVFFGTSAPGEHTALASPRNSAASRPVLHLHLRLRLSVVQRAQTWRMRRVPLVMRK